MDSPSNDTPVQTNLTTPTTGTLNTFQRIEMAKYSLSHLSDLIKFADQKALFLLAVLSFILGQLMNRLMQPSFKPESFGTIEMIIAGLCLITGLLAVTFAGKVVYPRLNRHDVQKGFLYWANVLQYPSFDDFKQGFTQFSAEDVLHNFMEQIYFVSRINEKKYRDLKCSFIATILSVIFDVALFFLLK